jgi:hypothetical protein
MTADWRELDYSTTAWFTAPSHAAGAALVGRIADLTADATLPDLEVRANGVRVRIPPSDPELAAAISAAAVDLALDANPAALQTIHLTIDTADQRAVMPFWQTALAYTARDDQNLVDPGGREPAISFRREDQPRPLRNRMHVDIVRTSEAVDAARSAIGQDPYGPYGLALADADGNEIDLVPGGALADSPEITDWRTLFGAMTYYPTTSPSQAAALATESARLADDAGFPLLIDVRPTGVTLDTGKDQWEDDEGPKPAFLALAGQLQSTARDLGLSADPTNLRFTQLAIDAVDVSAVRAFWKAVLNYKADERQFLTDIYDPHRLNPVIMFQQMPASEAARRSRIHVDLHIPHDQAQPRIDTALAAGGLVIGKSPNSCALTDPEGNDLHLHWHPQTQRES